MWDPYLFLQSLKLASSNLRYNFGLGSSLQETTFKTKTGGGLGLKKFRTLTSFCNC